MLNLRRLRYPAGLILVAGIVAAGWWYRGNSATAPQRPQRRGTVVAVEVAPVQRMALRDLRRFSGTLRARSQFDVAAKITGRLHRLLVDLGDTVRNGQVVARLDDDEYQQQVAQARAELAVAQAGLTEAGSLQAVKQARYARVRQLHARQIASDSELETAQVEAGAQEAREAVARAQVAQREAALRAAEVRLSYTVIRAAWGEGPSTRVVAERLANEGQLLAVNQAILTVVDGQVLTAVVFVAERDYPRLAQGQPAAVTAEAYPDQRFKGRIERLAPVFREASRQARLEVEVDNAAGLLKPGMFAAVEVLVGQVADATTVPIEAVVTRDGRQGVFLADLERHIAQFVPIRLGIAEGGVTQVVAPALAGQVVTLGNHLLSDGTAIVLPAAAPATGADGGKAERGKQRPGGGKGRRPGGGDGGNAGGGSAGAERTEGGPGGPSKANAGAPANRKAAP